MIAGGCACVAEDTRQPSGLPANLMKVSARMVPWRIDNPLSLAPVPPAHVRWFVVGGGATLDRAAIFSGVTLLALVVIALAVGGGWAADRLAARWGCWGWSTSGRS